MPTGQQILTHPWDPTHTLLWWLRVGGQSTPGINPGGVKHLNWRLLGWVRAAQHRAHRAKDVLGSGARRAGEQSSQVRQPLLTLPPGHVLNSSSELLDKLDRECPGQPPCLPAGPCPGTERGSPRY